MNTLIMILLIIACVLLILIVLVQNSKGGGLVSNFSSSNQIMGVRKTADFLEKATWTLAIAVFILSMAGSLTLPREEGEQKNSVIQEQVNNSNDIPVVPTVPPTTTTDEQKTDNQ